MDSKAQLNEFLSTVYYMTKSWDNTRPCIDTSGNYHTVTDIYDVHDYTQNPAEFREYFDKLKDGEYFEKFKNRQNYLDKKNYGKPFFVSEYGGIGWSMKKNGNIHDGYNSEANVEWGYGNNPQTEEEFIERYRGLTDALLDNPCMFGFCYTQLYDIEQEINGLYTYEREPKFDISVFFEINSRKAKIED